MEIDLEKYKTCRMCEECDPEYAFCCKPLIAHIERLEEEKRDEIEVLGNKINDLIEYQKQDKATLATYKEVVEKMRETLKAVKTRLWGWNVYDDLVEQIDQVLQAAKEGK